MLLRMYTSVSTAVFVLALCTLIIICESDSISNAFISDYYGAKNINHIIIFGCWNSAIEVLQNLMNLKALISHIPIVNNLDLEKILRVNYYHVGVVLNFDCSLSGSVLEQFSNQLLFNESYHWLVITNSVMIPAMIWENLKLTVESELTLAVRNDDGFLLSDIYNPSYYHGGLVRIIDKGQWTLEGGIKDKLKQYKYERRANLQKLSLNFSVAFGNTPSPDFHTFLTTRFNIGMDAMTRSHYPLMLHLQDMYNFTMKIHQATTWGYLVNGTFNGLIGDMIAGFIDMSITPFGFDEIRYPFVDYTVETWFATFIFTFIHPKNSNLRNNFFKPFANDAWWMILLGAVIYWLLLLLSVKVQLNYDTEKKSSIETPISETSLTTVAALSAQGMSFEPTFISGRIIFLSLFLWGLLLFQFYSASIVSSLLMPPPRWIKTLKNLSDSDLGVGCLDAMYYRNLFETSKDPESIELYHRKIKATEKDSRGSYYPLLEGFRKAQKGGFAFGTQAVTTYQIITETFSEDDICQLQDIKFSKPQTTALILRKHSPFRKMMTYGLRKMVQSGLIKRGEKLWRAPRPQCPETHNSQPTAMSITEFSPALFLLCFGIGISLIILLMENLYYYRANKLTEWRKNTEIQND